MTEEPPKLCTECKTRPTRSPTTSYCFECFHGFGRVTDGKGLDDPRSINGDK